MSKMKNHKLSAYFPMLPEPEFQQLKDSIKEFGLLEPITILNGQILDGRNRYRACDELGIKPKFRDYSAKNMKPIDFVVAANMRRRHLTEAQKAQVIIDIEGKPAPGKPGPTGGSSPRRGIPSYSALAHKAGVSAETIARISEVQDRPAIVEALREGRMSTREAVRERMRPAVEKGKAVQPKTDFYKMSTGVAQTITWLREITRRDWSSGLRMGKMDVKGHIPRLIGYVDEAIAKLQAFKAELEKANG